MDISKFESIDGLQIQKSNRGSVKVIYRDHIYLFRRENVKGDIFLRCVNRKCSGSLQVLANKELKLTLHNHEADSVLAQKVIYQNEIKDLSVSTSFDSRSIFDNVSKKYNDDFMFNVKPKSVYKNICNTRIPCSKYLRSNIPNDLPDFLKNTNQGKKFLYDSLYVNEECKFMIYSTKENIEHASHSSIWLADSTFFIVPSDFYQLLTIHIKINDCIIPAFYVLMADKKAETYKEVFGRIQLMITKEPEIIILDFELAQ